jgi:hypothetical protein
MNTEFDNQEIPKIENKKVPLWIIVMWVLGISWIVGYIFLGLQSSPQLW